jgi:hypothetical protein
VKKNIKKIYKSLLKIILLFLTFGYIYIHIQRNYFSFGEINKIFNKENIKLLLFAVFLIPVNWLCEAGKWKILISRIENISLAVAVKAVLTGMVFGIITPNRIGELGGRIFVLKRKNRPAGIMAATTGSLVQLSVTLLFGLISLIFFLIKFGEIFQNGNRLKDFFALFSVIGLFLFCLLILFNFKSFVRFISRLGFMKKYSQRLLFAAEYSFKTLLFVFGISIFRYFIFISQFYFLLLFFNVDIDFISAFSGIALTFSAIAVIPTLTLTELGIRGSAAVYFIGYFSNNDFGIISATLAVWIINIALPTAVGSFFFFRAKL